MNPLLYGLLVIITSLVVGIEPSVQFIVAVLTLSIAPLMLGDDDD